MNISASIDWLAITSHNPDHEAVHPRCIDDPFEDITPRNGYTLARRFSTGVVEYQNPDRPGMGTHVIYTARTMHNIRESHELSPLQLLSYHVWRAHNVARLDVAIDVRDTALDPVALFAAFDDGKASTRVRSGSLVRAAGDGGVTAYIGSTKTRKRLLRVYDKAAQLRLPDNWRRIELELRGKLATKAATTLVNAPDKGQCIAGMVRGHCHWPDDPVWCAIVDAPAIPITQSNQQSDNTVRWLMKQCAPALARATIADSSVYGEFLAIVARHIDDMRSGSMHD